MRSLRLGMVGVAGGALLAALACRDNAPPPPVQTSRLHFVVEASTAPPLYHDTVSFLVTVGQSADTGIYYRDPSDSTAAGEEFLRFEVPGDGLLRRPDGTLLKPGDTVRISIRVEHPDTLAFLFQPSGLQFNPNDPARLKVQYNHSDHDYNDDGTVDDADSTIQSQLDAWKNDPPSTLWFKQSGVNFESLQEIDVNVFSFSQFAIAW